MSNSILECPTEQTHFFTVEQLRYLKAKRAVDLIISLLALIILFPIFILVSIALKIEKPSAPIIFQQTRVGRNGKPFTIYKFRSMVNNAPHEMATSEFFNAEKYITAVGKILRKTSIDELPQFYNVLRGDMSILGPRPLILNEEEVHRYRLRNGIYRVRPGISGLAQVHGRDAIDDACKVLWDFQYVENIGLKMDMSIFIKSIIAVVKGTGISDGANKELTIEKIGTNI